VPTVNFSIVSASIGDVIWRLFTYLTPLIPLSFKGEGEISYVREASPLFNSPLVYTPSKGRGKDYF